MKLQIFCIIIIAIVIKAYCVYVVVDLKLIFLKKHYLFQNWFMLTIVIKAYCVNIMADIKPIYLSKHYLFQNTIYDLDKIYKLD